MLELIEVDSAHSGEAGALAELLLQVDKCNIFFSSELSGLSAGLHAATHKPQALASALRLVVDKGGLSAHPAAVPSELARLARGPAAAVGDGGADARKLHGFLRLCDGVESLQRLAFVNHMALSKVARRHRDSPSAAECVAAQPFFASEAMLTVWRQARQCWSELFASVDGLESLQPPASECDSCADPAEFPVHLACGHGFCARCIANSIRRSHNCPCCAKPVDEGERMAANERASELEPPATLALGRDSDVADAELARALDVALRGVVTNAKELQDSLEELLLGEGLLHGMPPDAQYVKQDHVKQYPSAPNAQRAVGCPSRARPQLTVMTFKLQLQQAVDQAAAQAHAHGRAYTSPRIEIPAHVLPRPELFGVSESSGVEDYANLLAPYAAPPPPVWASQRANSVPQSTPPSPMAQRPEKAIARSHSLGEQLGEQLGERFGFEQSGSARDSPKRSHPSSHSPSFDKLDNDFNFLDELDDEGQLSAELGGRKQACERCHRAKVACDGNPCSRCARLGGECLFSVPRKRTRVQQRPPQAPPSAPPAAPASPQPSSAPSSGLVTPVQYSSLLPSPRAHLPNLGWAGGFGSGGCNSVGHAGNIGPPCLRQNASFSGSSALAPSAWVPPPQQQQPQQQQQQQPQQQQQQMQPPQLQQQQQPPPPPQQKQLQQYGQMMQPSGLMALPPGFTEQQQQQPQQPYGQMMQPQMYPTGAYPEQQQPQPPQQQQQPPPQQQQPPPPQLQQLLQQQLLQQLQQQYGQMQPAMQQSQQQQPSAPYSQMPQQQQMQQPASAYPEQQQLQQQQQQQASPAGQMAAAAYPEQLQQQPQQQQRQLTAPAPAQYGQTQQPVSAYPEQQSHSHSQQQQPSAPYGQLAQQQQQPNSAYPEPQQLQQQQQQYGQMQPSAQVPPGGYPIEQHYTQATPSAQLAATYAQTPTTPTPTAALFAQMQQHMQQGAQMYPAGLYADQAQQQPQPAMATAYTQAQPGAQLQQPTSAYPEQLQQQQQQPGGYGLQNAEQQAAAAAYAAQYAQFAQFAQAQAQAAQPYGQAQQPYGAMSASGAVGALGPQAPLALIGAAPGGAGSYCGYYAQQAGPGY